MKRLLVDYQNSQTEVLVGEDIARVEAYITTDSIFIITDGEVRRLLGDRFPQHPVYELPSGETSKCLSQLEPIYAWLLEQGAHRASFLLGIGGGVVGDITGFVASTYMRGIAFGLIPSTLLAQIDASLGGKNGVNFGGYKNIIGSFRQPQFVLCDPALLATLPLDERRNGLAEMVKHAIIGSPQSFDKLERMAQLLLNADVQELAPLILESIQVKIQYVTRDEHELGLRKILNLGHSVGHAIEKISGLPHGKCVSVGLAYAARLSVARCGLSSNDCARICLLLNTLGLPTATNLPANDVFKAMFADKKKMGPEIDFVLIRALGNVEVQRLTMEQACVERFLS